MGGGKSDQPLPGQTTRLSSEYKVLASDVEHSTRHSTATLVFLSPRIFYPYNLKSILHKEDPRALSYIRDQRD